jgi:hypothetical protein
MFFNYFILYHIDSVEVTTLEARHYILLLLVELMYLNLALWHLSDACMQYELERQGNNRAQ